MPAPTSDADLAPAPATGGCLFHRSGEIGAVAFTPEPAAPRGSTFVALSKFVVANDKTAEVKEAFRNRPHLVDGQPGFVRMEVFSPLDRPEEIWLVIPTAGEKLTFEGGVETSGPDGFGLRLTRGRARRSRPHLDPTKVQKSCDVGITYWTDAASFDLWHHSHLYHASHKGIPKGLKLVPGETRIRRFEHVAS